MKKLLAYPPEPFIIHSIDLEKRSKKKSGYWKRSSGNSLKIMIFLTDDLSKFDNAKQRCSYAGTTPTIRPSRASVRGKSRTSKMGIKNVEIYSLYAPFQPAISTRPVVNRIKESQPKGKVKN